MKTTYAKLPLAIPKKNYFCFSDRIIKEQRYENIQIIRTYHDICIRRM